MWWVGGHQTVCVMLSSALCALTLCQVTYELFRDWERCALDAYCAA